MNARAGDCATTTNTKIPIWPGIVPHMMLRPGEVCARHLGALARWRAEFVKQWRKRYGPPMRWKDHRTWPTARVKPTRSRTGDAEQAARFYGARIKDRETGLWLRRKNARRRDVILSCHEGDVCTIETAKAEPLDSPNWKLYSDALPTIERKVGARLGIYGRRIGNECAIDVASNACIEAMRKWDGTRSFEAFAWGIAKRMIGDLAYRAGLRSKTAKK